MTAISSTYRKLMVKSRHVLEEKDSEAVLASSCHSPPHAGSFIIIKWIASHKYHHLKSHFLQLQRVSLSIAVRRERATCLIQMQSNLQATHSLTHTLCEDEILTHTFFKDSHTQKKKNPSRGHTPPLMTWSFIYCTRESFLHIYPSKSCRIYYCYACQHSITARSRFSSGRRSAQR